MQWKVTEFQSAGGDWHVNCPQGIGTYANQWWFPARIFNITPAAYAEWVIKNYEPDYIHYNKEKNFVSFSWDRTNYGKCHKLVLKLNQIARQKNISI